MDDRRMEAAKAVLAWRKRLWVDNGENRAARARLRRCGSIGEALFEPRTIELLGAVAGPLDARFSRERVILLAMILARAEHDGGAGFASALGQTADGKRPSENERPRLSPIRFRALITAAWDAAVRDQEWDRFAQALRRALAILGPTPFNVGRFADDVVFLSDRVLQRWTYDYWQSPPPEDVDREAADKTLTLEETP